MGKFNRVNQLKVNLPENLGGSIMSNVSWFIENDGIGSYEFWGAKGYDAGTDYVVIEEITPVFEGELSRKEYQILEYIKDNFEAIRAELEPKIYTAIEDENDI